jgi:hypothetical protein
MNLPKDLILELIQKVLTGYFGTKHRAELLLRLEGIKELL